jgi:hypothetical protein
MVFPQVNNYQRFELLILVAATISHHSQSSHRDPVADEFSGETTPQQIANLRVEISQLRGQLEFLQVTVETLSKNMVTASMFHIGPSLNVSSRGLGRLKMPVKLAKLSER